MEENKPQGLAGNKNAAKPDDQKAESYIHARCTSSDKAGWVKAAQSKGMKLTEWIVSVLNEAVRTSQKTYGSENTKIRGFETQSVENDLKNVVGYRQGVDTLGFILELELDCGHRVEFSREHEPGRIIPEKYLCDKCSN